MSALTKDQREELIDRAATLATLGLPLDDYIDTWCENNFGDHHCKIFPVVKKLLDEDESGLHPLFFETYHLNHLIGIFESFSDEDLIQTAIDVGAIDNLEGYLENFAEVFNSNITEGV